MPANKSQHYVPKSYFRLFSKDQKQIEVYNLKRGQTFTSPINPMCAKDYFYSKEPEIEKSLSPLEYKQSNIMKLVITSKKLPTEKEYFILLSFICLQHARTESAKIKGAQAMKFLSDEIVGSILGPNPDYEITFPEHLMKMQFALQSIPLIGDMMPVILINNTQRDFVFSDNPVVFHNTYLNKVDEVGVLGLQSPGLQIFCPLDSKIMFMLYDPKFYSINIGADYKLEIDDEKDVESLNALQFLNCNENIFYSDRAQENKIKEIHRKNGHLTGKRKMKKEVISIPSENGQKREFVHVYEERPNYELKLSFVNLNSISGNIEFVRNPEMVDRIKKDMKKYDKSQSSGLFKIVYEIEIVLKRLKYRLSTKFHNDEKRQKS